LSHEADEQVAATIKANIEMIAEKADAFVTAVIEDAEKHGLEASVPRLTIPLVETQAFDELSPDFGAMRPTMPITRSSP
jgi:hypothetical protein